MGPRLDGISAHRRPRPPRDGERPSCGSPDRIARLQCTAPTLACVDHVECARCASPSAADIEPRKRRVRTTARAPGDGAVTRASALHDERSEDSWRPRLVSPIAWTRAMFFFRSHVRLTRDPAFLDNLLYALLEEPRGAGPSAETARPAASTARDG